MANMNIRMDDATKKQAEVLFAELGMNMTTAVNVFLKQAVREQGMPFDITARVPNEVTLKALQEGDRIANDKSVHGYTDMKSLRGALEV